MLIEADLLIYTNKKTYELRIFKERLFFLLMASCHWLTHICASNLMINQQILPPIISSWWFETFVVSIFGMVGRLAYMFHGGTTN